MKAFQSFCRSIFVGLIVTPLWVIAFPNDQQTIGLVAMTSVFVGMFALEQEDRK